MDRGEVIERRSLMKIRKDQWSSTTAAIELPGRKSERRIDSYRGKFGNQRFVPEFIEYFRYVQRDSRRFTEMPKSGRPKVREKRKKITSRAFFTKAILAIRDKI